MPEARSRVVPLMPFAFRLSLYLFSSAQLGSVVVEVLIPNEEIRHDTSRSSFSLFFGFDGSSFGLRTGETKNNCGSGCAGPCYHGSAVDVGVDSGAAGGGAGTDDRGRRPVAGVRGGPATARAGDDE